MKVGARESEVDEPNSSIIIDLKRVEPILCVEFEAYPEAKLLMALDLKVLVKRHGSFKAVACLIGASEAFVRQKSVKLE